MKTTIKLVKDKHSNNWGIHLTLGEPIKIDERFEINSKLKTDERYATRYSMRQKGVGYRVGVFNSTLCLDGETVDYPPQWHISKNSTRKIANNLKEILEEYQKQNKQ